MSRKITPFLWFDNNAEEAMDFYVSIFDDAEILDVSRYGEGGPMPAGTLMTATFRLEGQEFMALNAGPHFTFNEAISFFISCESQDEVDRLWARLTEGGGEPGQCGWLKDRYGLSWQVIPKLLGELLGDDDRERTGRVMKAMLQMTKIDCAVLQRAYDGE